MSLTGASLWVQHAESPPPTRGRKAGSGKRTGWLVPRHMARVTRGVNTSVKGHEIVMRASRERNGYPKAPVRALMRAVERILKTSRMLQPNRRVDISVACVSRPGSGDMLFIGHTQLRDLYNAWDALRPPREKDAEPGDL